MTDVLLATTCVPFFTTAASIFMTAFLDFDWPEEIGHILGERFNERLCGFISFGASLQSSSDPSSFSSFESRQCSFGRISSKRGWN